MANPSNNFSNFFSSDEPHPMMDKFKPTIKQAIMGLIEMTAQSPMFYMDPQKRLMVCAVLAYATQELAEMKEKNIKPADVYPGDAAFMMVVGDMMSMTYDEFAGDQEREMFPHNRGNFEQDMRDEYGDDA
jgi:hypothetical protein